MTRGKKILAILAAVFVILIAYASYDIGRRTTFPGSRPQLQERIRENYFGADTLKGDSVTPKSRKY